MCGDVALNPGPDSTQVIFDDNSLNKGLTIGAWNINRLSDSKFQEIKVLLNLQKIDILFLIETFLKPKKPDSVYTIPGYEMHRKDRTGRTNGGGILAYVNNNLKVSRAFNLEENDIEVLWLNVCPYKSNRPLLIGTVYRPPSSHATVDQRLEMNIETAYLKNKETHILGDFNIDYFKPSYKKHLLTKALKSMSFTQLVNSVTRPVSSTCLDHFYTTNPEFITDVKVHATGLADHLPVFVRRKYINMKNAETPNSDHITIKYRDTKNLNIDDLLSDLSLVPWDVGFVFDEIDDVLFTYEKLLDSVLQQHIPIREKTRQKESSATLVQQRNWTSNQRERFAAEKGSKVKHC